MMTDNIMWLDFNDAPSRATNWHPIPMHFVPACWTGWKPFSLPVSARRIRGGKFYVGDVDGNPGKSLVVELDGPRRGLWKDFATDEGGDVIDLWARSQGRPPDMTSPAGWRDPAVAGSPPPAPHRCGAMSAVCRSMSSALTPQSGTTCHQRAS
jgi:hypothetical protein